MHKGTAAAPLHWHKKAASYYGNEIQLSYPVTSYDLQDSEYELNHLNAFHRNYQQYKNQMHPAASYLPSRSILIARYRCIAS